MARRIRLLTTSRKEESFGALFHKLHRIESQLEKICSGITAVPEVGALPQPDSIVPWLDDVQPSVTTDASPPIWQQVQKPSKRDQSLSSRDTISFSGRLTWSWSTLVTRLPQEVRTILQTGQSNYTVIMESNRPPLLPRKNTSTAQADYEPSKLSVSLVRELSTAYFTTFNLANPILDREFFMRHTLPTAISTGFEYNIESCVVLITMALGCWGQKALDEAGLNSHRSQEAMDPLKPRGPESGIPGMDLFNEARKRMAFLLGNKSMQSCQCHLLTTYACRNCPCLFNLFKAD